MAIYSSLPTYLCSLYEGESGDHTMIHYNFAKTIWDYFLASMSLGMDNALRSPQPCETMEM